MGRLTTHVLDTANGCPARGMALSLYRLEPGGARTLLEEAITNADGRADAPLLADAAVTAGRYEIVFQAGAYFRARGTPTADPPFLDDIPIRFAIADPAGHYHVPLLVSPWSYATYRGS